MMLTKKVFFNKHVFFCCIMTFFVITKIIIICGEKFPGQHQWWGKQESKVLDSILKLKMFHEDLLLIC